MEQIENPKARLAILLIYLGLLVVANWIAFEQWLPHTDGRSLWLAAGLFSLLLSSFLVTPYFERPANYIASASASFVAVWLVIDWDKFSSLEQFLSVVLLVYLACVAVAAGIAVFLKRQRNSENHKPATVSKLIADTAGQDRLLFSIVIIFAVVLFHRDSPREILTILITLIVIVLVRPELSISKLYSRIRQLFADKEITGIAGTIAGFDDPGIVLVRQQERTLKFGQVLIVNDGRTSPKSALVLGYFGRDEGILLRAKLLELPAKAEDEVKTLARDLPLGVVAVVEPAGEFGLAIQEENFAAKSDTLVGLVAANTSLPILRLEVVQPIGLYEGTILEAWIHGNPVLYQLTDCLTREEIVFQKNNRGFLVAEARKIGSWDAKQSKIIKAPWLPEMFSPVFRVEHKKADLPIEAVGRLPGTNYPASISSIHGLVTHNTAILGILGVGKSFLALELLERMFAECIKVVCLDLTNQYASELSEFYNAELEEPRIQKIREAGVKDQENLADNPDEGGSYPKLRQAIYDDLRQFLQSEESLVKIYNPAEITGRIQSEAPRTYNEGGTWHRAAPFRDVTPVEITQIVSEACLDLLQDRMSDKARLCLIYEEAHSLVPEFNNVTVRTDQNAVSATARAILQGRKYGMGCLLISQRTANVTKTILNQCNTIFAFRTFDDTGMAFLENYLGSGYAHVLPELEERHVLFFGKASTCENPVLMRVNDREDFKRRFRSRFPPSKPVTHTPEPPDSTETLAPLEDDDIPF
ncbi:MAG: DUF87 domain-containing protein [Puniceicoccaceae bacterium]